MVRMRGISLIGDAIKYNLIDFKTSSFVKVTVNKNVTSPQPDSLADFEDCLQVVPQGGTLFGVLLSGQRPPPVLSCECSVLLLKKITFKCM